VSRIHPVNHLQSTTQLQVWWVLDTIHRVIFIKPRMFALAPDRVYRTKKEHQNMEIKNLIGLPENWIENTRLHIVIGAKDCLEPL
jgi:hypothetical protein